MRRHATCECSAPWPRPSQICRCAGCHETFAGVKPFDAHRRGRGIDRRCALALGDLAQAVDGRPNSVDLAQAVCILDDLKRELIAGRPQC